MNDWYTTTYIIITINEHDYKDIQTKSTSTSPYAYVITILMWKWKVKLALISLYVLYLVTYVVFSDVTIGILIYYTPQVCIYNTMLIYYAIYYIATLY